MGKPAPDISGKKYGRWTILSRAGSGGHNKHAHWIAICDCGTVRAVSGSLLRNGTSRSCGCFQSESVTERNTKHGYFYTKVYNAWNSMRDRCLNANHKHFKHYGGRGVGICASWGSFEIFLADMGEPPTQKHSLDRIDPDGDYGPSNCRWANIIEQRHSRRDYIAKHGNEALLT